MEKRVLAIYSFLEHKKGNKELAEDYINRARNKRFTIRSFLSGITNKQLLEETINQIMKIGTLEKLCLINDSHVLNLDCLIKLTLKNYRKIFPALVNNVYCNVN